MFGTSFRRTWNPTNQRNLSQRKEDESPIIHPFPMDVFHDVENSWNEKRRVHPKPVVREGPKPFGHVDIHPLDGGVTPPKLITVEPFFLDETLVTHDEFRKFVSATYYKTEAEQYGWSFVLISFLPKVQKWNDEERKMMDPEATDWIAVDYAYWKQPEGPGSTYKYREHHPVVHVSHKDAAEYCKWKGKRLPGEREWEAAARFSKDDDIARRRMKDMNPILYSWGNDVSWEKANHYVNLWGNHTFPWKNRAHDGWRGTNPVRYYPPNQAGFYDLTGNVWEWMRGGRHKQRIVRGGSYVDSLDGSFNHAATLGARATTHGTTTTGNIGFRCAKSPQIQMEMVNMHKENYDNDDDDDVNNVVDDNVNSIGEKGRDPTPRTRLSNEL